MHIGDIVHLNSGSPDLTVVALEGDNVRVKWETESIFPFVCLKANSATIEPQAYSKTQDQFPVRTSRESEPRDCDKESCTELRSS